jgi:hypothetical protein
LLSWWSTGETSEGPATGLSRAGPGLTDTTVSERGAYPGAQGRTSGQFF